MKYDFNQICDRKNTSCIKWDFLQYIFGHDDVIPMWVADMDFPVAPPIVEALKKRSITVEYMVKDNEGHGFHNEENRFDFYRAMEKFLGEHLK